MIGDKVIINNNDRKRAKKVLSNILSLPDKSVITIGGGSGTKKTELALCIQEELYKFNKKSVLISLDDYYKVHFLDRVRVRQIKGIKSVGLKEIDWNYIKHIIKEFKKGKGTLVLQQVNKYTGSYDVIFSYGIKDVNFLVIEGLYANYLKKIKFSNLAIHLKGSPEQTYKFRKRRGKENEDSKFRRLVVKKEFEEVQKLRKYADIVMEVE